MTAKRLVTVKDVLERASMSRSKFYEHINPTHANFDPKAPKPLKVGGRSVRFIDDEVSAWIDVLIQRGREQAGCKNEAA